MAFTVNTYDSEQAMATALSGTVLTFDSEQALNTFLTSITTEVLAKILDKGGKYTVVHDISIAGTLINIIGKGAKFTVIIET